MSDGSSGREQLGFQVYNSILLWINLENTQNIIAEHFLIPHVKTLQQTFNRLPLWIVWSVGRVCSRFSLHKNMAVWNKGKKYHNSNKGAGHWGKTLGGELLFDRGHAHLPEAFYRMGCSQKCSRPQGFGVRKTGGTLIGRGALNGKFTSHSSANFPRIFFSHLVFFFHAPRYRQGLDSFWSLYFTISAD